MAPNRAGRIFVPTNPDLANILGRTDLDFENFYFFHFLDPKFLDFQVPRYLKSENLKIEIHSAQNVGKVWISRKKILPAPFGAIPCHFLHGPKKSKKCQKFAYFPWWANGPYSPGLGPFTNLPVCPLTKQHVMLPILSTSKMHMRMCQTERITSNSCVNGMMRTPGRGQFRPNLNIQPIKTSNGVPHLSTRYVSKRFNLI